MSTEADQQLANDVPEQRPEDGAGTKEQEIELKTYREVAARHIDRLNEINQQIPKMLKYFATAISQLTNDPIAFHHPELQSTPGTLEARNEIFRVNATFCKFSVETIRSELVKQINALERYKVIPKSLPKYTAVKKPGQKDNADVVDPEQDVKNGGYGEFDVGVLNARANSGQVGGEDVLDRAKAILEELNRRAGNSDGDDMIVDG